ncbi:cytochrome P450 [Pilimelia terevasa]|uniref:Cytochrome P450 n=1 Tax=Pilimelia terevasa TaxID=53372 RepID=A0A8J3BJ34_9ACTN|nr:cytochrome P450 [Pilimelia terevasa]GGK12423.1 cytochrome P450 [Pilimelia terevasa]
MNQLPAPPGAHLWRWTRDPLALLRDGAAAGPVFRLRLWRPAVVGYRPDWNRAVLGDLDTFRSARSLSGLTPYLAAGVVAADVPGHTARRDALNPHFHRRALLPHEDRLAAVVLPPDGPFEALSWAAGAVRRMLNAALFGDRCDPALLAAFLTPLDRPLPWPLLPRPRLFRRMDAAIAAVLARPPAGSLAAAVAGLPDAAAELRVALAAGYDTTAHTLAWALWHLAGAPRWRAEELLPAVTDEILRLYPAGWIGSRRAVRASVVAGVPVPAGTLVLYSPLLTHRDPDQWPEPDAFRPERFADGRPAWSYLPFSAGRRTCLGAHLARLMLRVALRPFCTGDLRAAAGDPAPAAGITLRPAGPLTLEYRPRRARPARPADPLAAAAPPR